MALEAFLVTITGKGKRCLLIVDEAQNLTPRAVEELRMLSNFQFGNHAHCSRTSSSGNRNSATSCKARTCSSCGSG